MLEIGMYDYEVVFEGEEPEEARTEIFHNCLIDLEKREIVFRNRTTGEELLRKSRKDILKITRIREEPPNITVSPKGVTQK